MYFFKKNAKLLGVVTAIKGAFGTKLMLDDVVLDDVVTAQKNLVTGVVINSIVNLTQAEYGAIAIKDVSTLYLIVG